MADVLIAAYGSRGDIMPLTDIGLRLRERGHTVTITTNTDLVGEIEAMGLTARGIPVELETQGDEPSLKDALELVKPAGMRQLGDHLG
jgi:sterol 3beta-glucosyltransferase